MRAALLFVLLGFTAACTGSDHERDDSFAPFIALPHDTDPSELFLLHVTLINHGDRPVAGATLVTSIGDQILGISEETDAAGMAVVGAVTGAILTAYYDAEGPDKPVRLLSRVRSADPTTLRGTSMFDSPTSVPYLVTGMSQGDQVLVLADSMELKVAGTSGTVSGSVYVSGLAREDDGEATLVAMDEISSPYATRWGAATDVPLDASIVTFSLGTDLQTLSPRISVEVTDVPGHAGISAYYLREGVRFYLSGPLVHASLSSSGTITLSPPGKDVADCVQVSGSSSSDDEVWMTLRRLAVDGTAATLSLAAPPFEVTTARLALESSPPTIEIEFDGDADAVTGLLDFPDQRVELLFPADIDLSLPLPPVPERLSARFPDPTMQPLSGGVRLIEADFVDSPDAIWELRSKNRRAMNMTSRERRLDGASYWPLEIFP